jgi:hypothetical protein
MVGSGRRALVLATLTALLTGALTATAWAAGTGGPDGRGHDISHPQCDGRLPGRSAFGVVGINQGRPFSTNPCLAGQYRWAATRPAPAALYVNTGNPAPRSAYYWPRSGTRDPALCVDSRSRTDPGCAYDYGWHAAADALATGRKLGRAALGHTWWLDVEITNTWNGDGRANTAVLQGMYDHLRAHGVARVGVYSTGYQWRTITGGYSASSARDYRSAWARHFTPRYPLHAAPLWVAGGTAATARGLCKTSFTGAPARMVQFLGADGFDTNLVC